MNCKAMVLVGRNRAEFVGRNHIKMSLCALPGTLDLIRKQRGALGAFQADLHNPI